MIKYNDNIEQKLKEYFNFLNIKGENDFNGRSIEN